MNRQQRRAHEKENAKRPAVLTEVPKEDWAMRPPGLLRVWRSRRYLVQLHTDNGFERLSVCRTAIKPAKGREDGFDWADGITWDELQAIKRTVGYGCRWAVECYPPDDEVANVANMRHLWVLSEPPPFGWRP